MKIIATLCTSAGELDRKEIETAAAEFTLEDLAEAAGDWPLQDGDMIKIAIAEQPLL